jgi:pyruvate,orthophosphate dikinase
MFMSKKVYFFGGKETDGTSEMKNLLGGKGANLAEMAQIKIPVPPGFTITTEVCTEFYNNAKQFPEGLKEQVLEKLKRVEELTGTKFSDKENPLLVSVRSGARVSMPGMMDTVLNLGLNDDTIQGVIKNSGNERFAWDSYRRFIQMYGDVVMGMKPENKDEHDPFEVIIDEIKKTKKVEFDTELEVDDLIVMVKRFKQLIQDKLNREFPVDPYEQLWGAISAVFDSWNNERAKVYRKLNGFEDSWGTAVNVQAMVFGNMGNDCGTGVAFTRDPATGEKVFFGEYLINAQGEDVVAGIRTPQQVTKEGSLRWAKRADVSEAERASKYPSLEESMPQVFIELEKVYKTLEKHYLDMQDIEFTIQKGKLWLLQTRTGKRTAAAAVHIACEMVDEGMIDKKTAVLRVDPASLDQLLHPTFDPGHKKDFIAKGLPASPGAATGRVVFHADDAVEWAEKEEKVILVRVETSPEDLRGMVSAKGILTARGGMTSHAAVVARGMGKCCVAGCGDLEISYKKREFSVKDKNIIVKEGDFISINGSSGEIMLGEVPTVDPELSGNFGKIMAWADEYRKLGVRTNADTPRDALKALSFGAEGIGLCRTEHMFFEGERIKAMRAMILAKDESGRRAALKRLLPIQREDFYEIFKAMRGHSVTIRLLDPPLHEFVPHDLESQQEMADQMNVSLEKIQKKVNSLQEFNPMLGHRGCRLGITYPEITEMQVCAIFEAACKLIKEDIEVLPEVMVPLVGTKAEFKMQKELIEEQANLVMQKNKIVLDYKIGTMIEIPRAALIADKIAEDAEFFSFGTNDLTQMTFGYSRDDAGTFLPDYFEQGVLKNDPFAVLDQEGVGQLVTMACKLGRKTRKDLKIGICGEHGGEPSSVKFCHRQGMTYVSCSPYRVPIARLAAAHAALEE